MLHQRSSVKIIRNGADLQCLPGAQPGLCKKECKWKSGSKILNEVKFTFFHKKTVYFSHY